jgi:lipoyl(octanoyl) transferase
MLNAGDHPMYGEKWRFLDSGKGSALFHMALDEAILHAVDRKESPPTFRLFEWDPSAITIGCSQKMDRVIDLERCARDGIDVIRRPTGGRAVFHDREIAFSVAGSIGDECIGGSIMESTRAIGMILLDALVSLGIHATMTRGARSERSPGIGPLPCFASSSRHEIAIGGRKLAGSAQRRIGGAFLQQGSLLTGPGHELIAMYLHGADTQYAHSLNERSIDLETATGMQTDISALKLALFSAFSRAVSGMIAPGGMTAAEAAAVQSSGGTV